MCVCLKSLVTFPGCLKGLDPSGGTFWRYGQIGPGFQILKILLTIRRHYVTHLPYLLMCILLHNTAETLRSVVSHANIYAYESCCGHLLLASIPRPSPPPLHPHPHCQRYKAKGPSTSCSLQMSWASDVTFLKR